MGKNFLNMPNAVLIVAVPLMLLENKFSFEFVIDKLIFFFAVGFVLSFRFRDDILSLGMIFKLILFKFDKLLFIAVILWISSSYLFAWEFGPIIIFDIKFKLFFLERERLSYSFVFFGIDVLSLWIFALEGFVFFIRSMFPFKK